MHKSLIVISLGSAWIVGCESGASSTETGMGVGASTTMDGPGTTTGEPTPPPTPPGPGETDPGGSSTGPAGSGDETTAADDTSEDPVAECGNGIIEDAEVCDTDELAGQNCLGEGFDGGTLACADDCSGYDTEQCVFFTCGNGVVDGADVCDGNDLAGATCIGEGFTSGTLACANDCASLDTSGCGTCGNIITDGDEPCDGIALLGQNCLTLGFEYGEIACLADCSDFDTSGCGLCGDGVLGGAESCDGEDLGGQTCASLGLTGGTLGCSESCLFDFSECEIPGEPFGSDGFYNGFSLVPPSLPCEDISGTGTATGLTDDDSQQVPMGFSFPVYGTEYSQLTIQSNGTIRWGDDDYLGFGNTCLPTVTEPSTNVLYVFWDDLNPTSGEVYYETLGDPGERRFVVQWDTPNFGGDIADPMRFQAVFHEVNGQIDVCYPDTINAANLANSGAEATAGIQLDSATGLQFSCNTPDLVDGTMLIYLPT